MRTIVTIIGIILSMALFTAVIEGAYSGLSFLRRCEIDSLGSWHGYVADLTGEEYESLLEDPMVGKHTSWQEVGWADCGSTNTYKPYVVIESIPEDFTDIVPLHMIVGRMPENESELLISEHLRANGNVEWKIGDVVTLDVGRRVSAGHPLTPHDECVPGKEELVDTVSRTYTIVGICKRMDISLEAISCPGYTAFTRGEADGVYNLYFESTRPQEMYAYLPQMGGKHFWGLHNSLLNTYGAFRNSGLADLVYGFAMILVFLISFGSISLIYNSFAISVSERTRLFGILKSIGATRKQIRATVLYEAMILAGIGIPAGLVVGCAGIGTTLYCLRDQFARIVNAEVNTRMYLDISPLPLAMAALICLLTTLIAAWIPAGKAVRQSPISAIRQTEDVKIRAKSVRISPLTTKLFGFEGMMAAKNFKRNKKRYRSVVLSLFLSVTLFISASSFCSYLRDSVETVAGDRFVADLEFPVHGDDAGQEHVEQLYQGFADQEHVDLVEYSGQLNILFDFDQAEITPEISNITYREDGSAEVVTTICFLQDEAFLRYAGENHIDAEKFFDPSDPKAILWDHVIDYNADAEGASWGRSYVFKDRKNLSKTGRRLTFQNVNYFDDERFMAEETGTDGQTYAIFAQTDAYEEYWAENQKEPAYTDLPEDALTYRTPAEAYRTGEFMVEAVAEEPPYGLSFSHPCLVLPYSMREAALKTNFDMLDFVDFNVKAEDSDAAFDEMNAYLVANGELVTNLHNYADTYVTERRMVTVINVFSYGFIILISLIALANVFNTISTNIGLRRREFAMLRSIGLSSRGFMKMMNYECLIYGFKGLIWGLPASIAMTYLIYRITYDAVRTGFYMPIHSIVIAVGSVFIVVFATMLYSAKKIQEDNPIDALKTENI